MWRPSFVSEYVCDSPISGDISNERCDKRLNWFDGVKCRFFVENFAFSWWKVSILSNGLSAMNAPPDLVCVQCPTDSPHRAGYSPNFHKIWICGNLFWNPFELRRVLTHELVHAFDFARAKIDLKNKEHIACTEIRAWNLSGECEMWRKFGEYASDDPLGVKWWSRKQQCVKQGAMSSMKGIENAENAIDNVFKKCFTDHWPFTTQPHMDTRFRDSPMLTQA